MLIRKFKFIIVLSLLSLSFAQVNELLPIPAFYVSSENKVESIIEHAKTFNFFPISYKEYLSGIINIPKNKLPFILITTNRGLAISQVNAFENGNLPPYHQNFDPLENLKVYNLSKVDFSFWVSCNKTQAFYTSDGITSSISIPQSEQANLFLYAPGSSMNIEIPSSIPFLTYKTPYRSKAERLKAKKPTIRGLHMTWDGVNTPEKVNALSAQMKAGRIDTIVIDFKSIYYNVLTKYTNYNAFMSEDNNKLFAYCPELQKTVTLFHKNNIKVSLRVVVAMDYWAERMNTDLLLWNKATNSAWKDPNKQPWIDLFSPETIRYYKKIVTIATMYGPEEIQLDYIRFPTEGHIDQAISRSGGNKPHYKALDTFLKEMVSIVDSKNIALSADIFGIVLWENKATNDQLGQNLITFMRYSDEICPMIYPSHFHKGFEGIPLPGDAPYAFIKKGAERFKMLTAQYPYYKTLMVPWLQAFQYLAPSYSPIYIKEEIRACTEVGMDGFLAWNAANNYNTFFKGLQISNY